MLALCLGQAMLITATPQSVTRSFHKESKVTAIDIRTKLHLDTQSWMRQIKHYAKPNRRHMAIILRSIKSLWSHNTFPTQRPSESKQERITTRLHCLLHGTKVIIIFNIWLNSATLRQIRDATNALTAMTPKKKSAWWQQLSWSVPAPPAAVKQAVHRPFSKTAKAFVLKPAQTVTPTMSPVMTPMAPVAAAVVRDFLQDHTPVKTEHQHLKIDCLKNAQAR